MPEYPNAARLPPSEWTSQRLRAIASQAPSSETTCGPSPNGMYVVVIAITIAMTGVRATSCSRALAMAVAK